MNLGLGEKVALVTASSKGLGQAIAREMAVEGARVVMCARSEATLLAARDAIRKETKAEVHAVAADVSTAAGIASVISEATSRFGRIDVLVTNAGGPPAGVFESHDWSVWEQAVNLTLRSAVELTRGVLPGMRQRRWGRIVNITSIAVKQPVANLM